jgi:D-tyrosyl-tRNA(Tyr) deacylase
MRVVIQRVAGASLGIGGKPHAEIRKGMLVLLGIEESDTIGDVEWLCGKITRLRIFPDAGGVMNLAITDIGGEIMVVSQFTLHAMVKKGNRPSYIRAARPETAIPLYLDFIEKLRSTSGLKITSGVFGAMMNISLVNEGPVTIIIDSKNRE